VALRADAIVLPALPVVAMQQVGLLLDARVHDPALAERIDDHAAQILLSVPMVGVQAGLNAHHEGVVRPGGAQRRAFVLAEMPVQRE